MIQSAVMTLTVKSGGADTARAVSVLPMTSSWVQEEATWNARRAGIAWTSAGGDLGPAALVQNVTNVTGAKVSFDVTALVRAAVSGATTSRYTRLALADLGASTNNPIASIVESGRSLRAPGAEGRHGGPRDDHDLTHHRHDDTLDVDLTAAAPITAASATIARRPAR